MFREMMRKNKQLPEAECLQILKEEKRGVLSVTGDNGYPYGSPMNHYFCEEDGKLYFHCGKAGHRLDALKSNDKVSFCVYDKGFRRENEWALNIRSVIVFGRISVIDDMEKIVDITAGLSRKFTDDEEYISKETELYAGETLLLQLTPEHICGKQVVES